MEKIKGTPFLKLIFKLGVFILLLGVCDFLIGSVLNYLYFHPKLKAQYETSYAFEKANEQIIIYGASTAENHFNPSIIKARTSYTCYNAGAAGQSILYIEALNRCILKRCRPEIIILVLDWTLYDDQSFNKLGALLPYYQKHPEIREIIKQRSRFESIKLLSHIYPFNSVLYQVCRQFYGTPRNKTTNGFLPENRKFKINYANIRKDLAAPVSVSSEKYIAFNNFISLCKEKKIKLILTIAPTFDMNLVSRHLFSFSDSLSRANKIPLINFAQLDKISGKKILFADNGHLNSNGADIFSTIFSDTLSKFIHK